MKHTEQDNTRDNNTGDDDVVVQRPVSKKSTVKRKVDAGDLDADDEALSEHSDDECKDEEPQYHWVRFTAMDEHNVSVLWQSGEVTHEPLAKFRAQIPPLDFQYHAKLCKMPPKQQQKMLAQLAKSSSKAASTGERKQTASRSHCERNDRRSSHPKKKLKQKQSKRPSKQTTTGSEAVAHSLLQTALADIHVTQATCSYCGTLCVLCFQCTATASCAKRVCMHCWTLATAEDAVVSPNTTGPLTTADKFFHCHAHGGITHLPVHPTVQKLGLPSDCPQTIGVWAPALNFPTYRIQLDAPTLTTRLLTSAGSSARQPHATAVILEYHSDVELGNVTFDAPPTMLTGKGTSSSPTEVDIGQVALLARFVDPATTKLVVLLTCGPYRKQLETIRIASQKLYPTTTFLLFDIPQLFVHDILPAVCSTVRQYLLYPTASPLHLAAEHFGKRLLHSYRPSFLFRGELLPVVHHSQDALSQCACGVTLKCRGLVHKAAGWEAFERFQLYRYSCKKSPSCGTCMLLPRC